MLFSSYFIQPICPPVHPHPPNPSHSQVIQEKLKCSCSNSQHSRHGASREKAAPLPPPLASSVRQLCLQSEIYRYKRDRGQPRVREDLYVSKFPCIPSSVSWCVVSDAEEKKCLDLSGNATAHHIKGTLECVRGLNSRDCMVRIKVAGQTNVHLFVRGPNLLQGRFMHGGFGGFALRMGQQMQPPCLRMTSTLPASATAWSWRQESPITEWVSLISAGIQ